MKKTYIFFLSAVLLSVMSCKNSEKSTSENGESQATKETITLQNNQKEIKVPVSPDRVVVFDMGALDVMDELGLTDRIVGMAKQSTPGYLRQYEEDKNIVSTGGLMEPNFEKVDAAQPELIIIGLRQLKDYDQYAEIAPTYVYDLDYKNFVGSIEENVTNLGKIFNVMEEAQKRLDEMKDIIASEKEKIESTDLKGMMVLFNNGKFSAFGHQSRFGYIFDDFGVIPQVEDVNASTHGSSISSEYILEQNPDLLFVVDRNAAIGEGKIQKKTIENSVIRETKAYKTGKIVYLSPETWYIAGGGIQSIEQAAKEVGAAYK